MDKHNTNLGSGAIDPFVSAKQWLDLQGVPYRQLTAHHLKIGVINFYPSTGTITVDGETTKRPDKGLVALKAILYSDKVTNC